ncbi:MAG: SDR family oxidoreductase [Bacteroidetes bacterium]|nr:SDR family oxidoreductase [Bacteroidota bacterium]
MKIEKTIAVVTGAGSGLGAAFASALVHKGAVVYGLGRNMEKLHALHHTLGDSFIPIGIDITDQTAINDWVNKTFSDSCVPNILINNAGVGYLKKIEELSLAHWHEMINTNLNGLFYLTSSIVPIMKRNRNAYHIINIGSTLGKTTSSDSAAYSATKYGLQGFSEALFKELRSFNIKVTCVNPGSIDTHFFEDSGIKPHHRMLQPNDIAALVMHILETPDNLLVDEITLRPLMPNASE